MVTYTVNNFKNKYQSLTEGINNSIPFEVESCGISIGQQPSVYEGNCSLNIKKDSNGKGLIYVNILDISFSNDYVLNDVKNKTSVLHNKEVYNQLITQIIDSIKNDIINVNNISDVKSLYVSCNVNELNRKKMLIAMLENNFTINKRKIKAEDTPAQTIEMKKYINL